MGWWRAMRAYWANLAWLAGRAGRSEFWWPVATVLALITAGFITEAALPLPADSTSVRIVGLTWRLIVWVCLLPTVTVAMRRMHDTGRTARWLLLALIPLLGWLAAAWFLSRPSRPSGERFDDAHGRHPSFG